MIGLLIERIARLERRLSGCLDDYVKLGVDVAELRKSVHGLEVGAHKMRNSLLFAESVVDAREDARKLTQRDFRERIEKLEAANKRLFAKANDGGVLDLLTKDIWQLRERLDALESRVDAVEPEQEPLYICPEFATCKYGDDRIKCSHSVPHRCNRPCRTESVCPGCQPVADVLAEARRVAEGLSDG